jgi:hypothetical protein
VGLKTNRATRLEALIRAAFVPFVVICFFAASVFIWGVWV